ncbi:MAG: DUF3021 domain-containing protein [Lachnospiraceae bacterium]|nr:DUF3021 domain-containing protein [Lachnospiraceae bacterium]
MKFSQRLILFSSIGFGLGVIVGVIICTVSATLSYADGTIHLCSNELLAAVGDPLFAFSIQTFASGLYGVLGFGGSAVYGIEEWGLLKCTLIHYLAVMTGFLILAFSMRWFMHDVVSLIIMLGIMTAVYMMIWLGNYLSYKAQLNEINRELDELKSTEFKKLSRA